MAFNRAKCDFCGDCLDLCQYTTYDKESGAEQIRQLLEGTQAPIVTECVTCAACNEYCEKGANPFDLLLRYQEKGAYRTTDSYNQLVEVIDQSPGEIAVGEKDKPVINACVIDVLPGVFEGKLFEGCTILRGGAYESVLGWIHVGKEYPLQETLQKKVDALADTGFEEIVMFHDDCYGAYTTKAWEYKIDVPFRVKHYVQFLRDYVKEHPESVTPLGMKIAYQRPCSSRYTPWIEDDIDELFKLIGVERVDRQYDRLHALCCGCPVSPHLGKETGERYKAKNIQDAKDHGAQAMVFMCQFCALQMRDEVAQAGMEPIFLSNLVRMALGEKPSFQPAGRGDDREPVVGAVRIVKGLV